MIQTELKYDISLARCHQLTASSQSIFLKLYKEDDCLKVSDIPDPTGSVCTEKADCNISLYSMDSNTDAKNGTGSTITTNISGMNEEVMLDNIRTESVWTPYCEFSTYNPKSPLTASYTINLNLPGQDSKYDEDDSVMGSPNVVMLMENSWQFADSEIADSASGLGAETCFEPHLHGNLYGGGEEEFGYGNFSASSQGCCLDEWAKNEGYRSPVECGLPVADVAGGERCGHVSEGGAKRCVGVATGDSDGLEETEIFCEENYVYS